MPYDKPEILYDGKIFCYKVFTGHGQNDLEYSSSGGRLAFEYQPHNTCVSKCLAIHHIQIFLLTHIAFMQPHVIFYTTMEISFFLNPC